MHKLFPSKPLGCYGDGGAIFTNDAEIAKACSEIRVHGQESGIIILELCWRKDGHYSVRSSFRKIKSFFR